MVKTTLVNIAKTQEYDVYIGRGSKWGNPYSSKKSKFKVMMVETEKEAMDMYRKHILNSPKLLNDLHELKGKRLGCFCKPKACHGDILIELIEHKRLLSFVQ